MTAPTLTGSIETADKQQLPVRSRHCMPFGAELQPGGFVRFRVWGPEAKSMHLLLEDHAEPLPMQTGEDGWHELITDVAGAGSHYRFLLPDGVAVPDPVSRYQPFDVNGPSEVTDPEAFAWTANSWKGRPWEEAVLYELHIGTFTPEGTFRAAIGKLDHLASLGVTALEIMSVGDFPGVRNWGYDGVLLYAPDSTYGHPDDLKALVDAAHARGIMVIIDVVYNHFGPEGNFLPQYFPDICTDRYNTPWGKALNFDADHSGQTREFIVHNALYWIEEFRMDGLRLDAVHAIFDTSSTHILEELCRRARTVAHGRRVHFILESDDKMWHLLARDDAAIPVSCTAQWNHDVQQLAALAFVRNASETESTALTERLGRALVEGFTTTLSENASFRPPDPGRPIPLGSFIAFLQSHDVVGNRVRGERITHVLPPDIVRALASIYLLLPQIPMLFMGEEWAASSPFPFFCDFGGDLAKAIREGRLAQFGDAARINDPAYRVTIPDPLADATFNAAKLQWNELDSPDHSEWLAWYRTILSVRRERIVPLITGMSQSTGSFTLLGPRTLRISWRTAGGTLVLEANLADTACAAMPLSAGEVIWEQGAISDGILGPWSMRWCLESTSDV